MQYFCYIVCAFVIGLPNIIRSEDNVTSYTVNDMPKNCGQPSIISYQIDGQIKLQSSYPWTVLIEYASKHKTTRTRADFRCAGNLIHSSYVVTAASCVFGANLKSKPVSVQVGSLRVKTGKKTEGDGVDIKIAETIVHEQYVPDSISQSNDIALLRLSRPVKDDEAIAICLPFAPHLKNKTTDSVSLVVVGFGEKENGELSDVKQYAYLYGLKSDECQKNHSYITSKQFCAYSEGGERPCHGDEGGPLLGQDLEDIKNPHLYLAGIVSIVNQNCSTLNKPSVYTKVDQYLDWIMSKITN